MNKVGLLQLQHRLTFSDDKESLSPKLPGKHEDAILGLAIQVFLEKGVGQYKNPNGAVIFYIKSAFDRETTYGRL